MKKYILALAFILLIFNSFSQERVFSLQTIDFSRKGNFGPNLKNYTQFGMNIGVLFSNGNNYLPLKQGNASFIDFNFRYKRRLNNLLSTGFDIFYSGRSYELKQFAGKTFPDTISYFKEYLNASDLGSGIYLRINFNKKRGNYLGEFLDLGVSGAYVFSFTQSTIIKQDNKKIKSSARGFDFYEIFHYGIYCRLGSQKQAFIFKYRLSPLFKSSFNYPDLPPFGIGYEISF